MLQGGIVTTVKNEIPPFDDSRLTAAETAHQSALLHVEQATNPLTRGIWRAVAWVRSGEVYQQTGEHEGMAEEIARLQAIQIEQNPTQY